MRVLVVGQFAWDQNEPSFCRGLRRAGAEVHELRVARPWPVLDLARRAQMKAVFGPEIWALNLAVLRSCRQVSPDAILAWRMPWLRRGVMRALRRLGPKLVLSNNDDPFGPDRQLRIWREFRRIVPQADACFAYRDANLAEYAAAGARRVFVLRSWFDEEVHYPVTLSEADRERYGSDATFVGHWEDDGREECISALVREGLRVRIFGSSEVWNPIVARRGWAGVGPVVPVSGDSYRRAVAGAKLVLAFLSKRNRDDYTRRCFEIPAMGAAMAAPRTRTLQSMFLEDREAIFFDSPEELLEKVRRYLRDDAARAAIAAAGRARCLADGHDVTSRARRFLADLATL